MKINTKQILKDLQGNEIKGITVGEALAEIVLGVRDALKIKRHSLATNFISKEEVTLDVGDFELIKNATEKDTDSFGKLNTLITAQLLNILNESK